MYGGGLAKSFYLKFLGHNNNNIHDVFFVDTGGWENDNRLTVGECDQENVRSSFFDS